MYESRPMIQDISSNFLKEFDDVTWSIYELYGRLENKESELIESTYNYMSKYTMEETRTAITNTINAKYSTASFNSINTQKENLRGVTTTAEDVTNKIEYYEKVADTLLGKFYGESHETWICGGNGQSEQGNPVRVNNIISSADLTNALSCIVPASYIADNWEGFSYSGSNIYYGEDQWWGYETVNGAKALIYNGGDSQSFTGYMSQNTYDDFEASVIMRVVDKRTSSANTNMANWQPASDDGCIAFIICATTDANGNMHTLSFVRSRNYGNSNATSPKYQYACLIQDFRMTGEKILWQSNTQGATGSWAGMSGCKIYVRRRSNELTIDYTAFGVLDLDSTASNGFIYNIPSSSPFFNKEGFVGIGSYSQANVYFQSIQLTEGGDFFCVDNAHNEQYLYDGNFSWRRLGFSTFYSYLPNTLFISPMNGKLYGNFVGGCRELPLVKGDFKYE